MHRIKNLLLLMAVFMLNACIKPYDPQISGNEESKYVVSGRVTDQEGWQEAEVSLSSPIENPEYIPVSGCLVSVLDGQGNVFDMDEYNPGKYRVWMEQESLERGRAYRVRVTTPSGDVLVSGFDTMPAGPPVDTVYVLTEDVPSSGTGVTRRAMQFYIDLDAEGDYSRFYKWEVVETWEYHAAHPAQYYYDGEFHEIVPPDSSKLVCWITGLVKNVFTVSTKSLSQNSYKKYPLQTVDGRSDRLEILYSILVRQLALSEDAYNYWEQLRINSNEQGGLYEKQPFAIKGNLVNMTRPEQDILGYFYAASVSSKRYFFTNRDSIPMEYLSYCSEDPLGMFGWKEFFPQDYPVYFYYNEIGLLRILNLYCLDCTLQGGTTVKPDFWP